MPNERGIPWIFKCYVEIEYDETNGAVKRFKGGKLSGIDKVAVEYLKRGGLCTGMADENL